jgi:hypothetical protein
MNEQALPDLGLSSDRMLEVEVALRLAAFLLSLPRSGSIASVAIDGGSLKVRDVILFDIAQLMTGNRLGAGQGTAGGPECLDRHVPMR